MIIIEDIDTHRMKQLTIIFLSLSFLLPYYSQAQDMDNTQLGNILTSMSDSIVGSNGQWQMDVKGALMICLTDETHNRMRIISPIKSMEEVSKKEMYECMEANFHTALDVKYAVSEDVMWAVYIHPLKELTADQARDAIKQVFFAVMTYGTTYSSTNLSFPEADSKEN